MEQEERQSQPKVTPVMNYFSGINDPRAGRNKLYPLHEVIVITILAIIGMAEGREDIERYGKAKKGWPGRFLKLEHGIPRHDVYRRVMYRIKPEEIENCFMDWVRAVKQEYGREIIAIDGKTVRGHFKTGGKGLHIVSAWATENRLVFGQIKTEEKSNEITAIPGLLEKLALEGCIVTTDAMGCQYKTADKIVEKKADYLFCLKGNQETLHEDVKEYFAGLDFSMPACKNKHIRFQTVSSHEQNHGRIEDRDYAVSDDVDWLIERHPAWNSIRSIGMAESTREMKGDITVERRYFVSSMASNAEEFARAVRGHWGIENSLHYVLDVAFGEDGSRLRKDKGPENMAIMRKLALTVTMSDTKTKSSIIGRRKQIAWSNEYLEQLLFQSQLASDSA
jgi:predicted transposase YbfD/YdcC